MSPQREFSWILLSVVFHFHPSGFIPCLLRESFHGFCPQWFFIFIPSGFIPCLLRENFHGFCPQWSFNFIPSGFILCLLSKNPHGPFALGGLLLLSPVDTVSPQRILSWILPVVVFIFYFTFKSPTVLSSRGPLLLYFCDVWVCGLMSINLQMVSSIGFRSLMLEGN